MSYNQEKLTAAFFRAVQDFDIAGVKRMVSQGVDINSKYDRSLHGLIQAGKEDLNPGSTPLMFAVKGNREVIALYLISQGAALDIQNDAKDTALIYSARKSESDEKIFKALVKAGADVNIQGDKQDTALIFSAVELRLGCVNLLMEAGADLDLQNEHGITALIAVISCEDLDIVKALVKGGADLDLQTHSGLTALIHSADLGRVDSLRALVEGGASLDLQTKRGRTALMEAAKWGTRRHEAVIDVLLSAGANKLLRDSDGKRARDLVPPPRRESCLSRCLSRKDHSHENLKIKLS